MNAPQTMTNIWMYADAQPSLEAAAATAIDLAARQGASLETEDEPLLDTPAGRALVRILRQDKSWSLYHESLIASRLGPAGTQQYLDIQLQYSKDCGEQLLAEAGCKEVFHAIHHPKGEPGKVISDLAEEIGADLVVVGSAARRGLQGFFIGSVAETILSQLRRSALVLKRPGFVSLVRGRK